MKKIVIFIGPPGSGKGTQAQKLADKFGYAHLSTGNLLRALGKKENRTASEDRALEQIKRGILVSDQLIFNLTFDEIEKNIAAGKGVALDGAIRSIAQAKAFQRYFIEHGLEEEIQAIEVALSDQESRQRLLSRKLCDNCQKPIPVDKATKNISACPHCGGILTARVDDNEQAITQRITGQGNAALKPIRDYYRKLGLLTIIDGNGTMAQVEQMVNQAL